MSDSSPSTERTRESDETVPRAVIHKKILDVAESRPDVSMEAIADDVSGATVSIVEQVLEEYGDPGGTPDESDGNVGGEDTPGTAVTGATDVESESDADELRMSDHDRGSTTRFDRTPDLTGITEKQLETLREIYKRPDATQAALADTLGVSDATISQRVNAIDGFDWSDRHEFVETLFENEPDPAADETATETESDGSEPTPEAPVTGIENGAGSDDATDDAIADSSRAKAGDEADGPGPATGTGSDRDRDRLASEIGASLEDLTEQLTQLTRRLEELEERLDDSARRDVLSDPELAHKVVHACLTADHISEEEELQLLKAVTEA